MTRPAPDPVVSVLIPAFQAEATLLRAIGSLRAGGNGTVPTEILVEADDDNGYDAAAALPGVVVQRTGQVASGVGAARNRALARARGAWIAYVDADDEVDGDWLPALLQAAGPGAAAVSRMTFRRGARVLGTLAPDRLTWQAAGRHGASWRGIVRRAACPAFVNDLSQDILHLAEVMLRQGALPVAPTRYHLHLGDGTVTAAGDFAARIDAAYLRHMDYLATAHAAAPDLPAALALFRRKQTLNAEFVRRGAGQGYYDFILAEDPA